MVDDSNKFVFVKEKHMFSGEKNYIFAGMILIALIL